MPPRLFITGKHTTHQIKRLINNAVDKEVDNIIICCMNKSEKILAFIRQRKETGTEDIQKKFSISRQMVHKYLRPYIESGDIVKTGRTKGVSYSAGNAAWSRKFSKVYPVKGADADRIFEEIDLKMGLKQNCNIVSYRAVENCLKELAGNVIFHSGSELMMINISMDNYNVNIRMEDSGTGIFSNLRRRYGLNDEGEVLLVLTRANRGMGDNSLGTGIMKCMESGIQFEIQSGKHKFAYKSPDTFLAEDINLIKGTIILLKISRNMKLK